MHLSLAVLDNKTLLEREIEKADGEMTEELIALWENTELELAQKADELLFLDHQNKMDIEKLSSFIEMAKQAKESTESRGKRMKQFLRSKMDEAGIHKLQGALGSISTSTTVKREVDLSLVEPEKRIYEVEMNHEQFKAFSDLVNLAWVEGFHGAGDLGADFKFSSKCNLSQLPDKHHAISEEVNCSVRFYPKRSK